METIQNPDPPVERSFAYSSLPWKKTSLLRRSIAPSAVRHLSGKCPNTIVHSKGCSFQGEERWPSKFWRRETKVNVSSDISFLKESVFKRILKKCSIVVVE